MRPRERKRRARRGRRWLDRSGRFVRRCLTNLGSAPFQVEFPHLFEVDLAEAATETLRQIVGKAVDQALAVGSPLAPALLFLDDLPADLPVRGCHDGIDGAGSGVA